MYVWKCSSHLKNVKWSKGTLAVRFPRSAFVIPCSLIFQIYFEYGNKLLHNELYILKAREILYHPVFLPVLACNYLMANILTIVNALAL
jgi:hypothetical protein